MDRSLVLLFALALGTSLTACDKPEASQDPEPSPAKEGGDEADDEAKKQAEDEARWAERLQKAEADAEEVEARWTPELEAELTALIDAEYKTSSKALEAILESGHRAPGNAERDPYRHPAQTLAFFGIEPNMRVFEFGQGAGWYTEILAPYLAKSGALVLALPAQGDDSPRGRFSKRAAELFLTAPGNLYAQVQTVEQSAEPDAPVNFGPEGSLDAIVVFRMMHNVHRADLWERVMPPALTALKPGGVLAVIQHRAPEGADPDEWATKGYLPEAWLIEKVESYGFRLDETSEINANPKDTKDYEGGVWTLPPVLAKGDEDKETYLEIGESDRSTLRFVKPD